MDESKLLESLLFLNNSITFVVNLKTKTIESVYNGKNKKDENITYEEFAHNFCVFFGLNDAAEAKLIRFLDNLLPSSAPFQIPVDYRLDDGSPIKLIYNGFMFEKNMVLFTVKKDIEDHTNDMDQLTKLYTKNYIVNKIKKAIDANQKFALMVIDIDNFKLFNDTYGHLYGDIILVETASALKKFADKRGYVARIGGDEFLVMLYTDATYDTTHKECTALRETIRNFAKHNIKQENITVTVGCSTYPNDGLDYDLLFKKADKALYRGKRKGRNCFIIYSEEKCGEITDEMISDVKAIDRLFNTSNNYSIITGVLEILSRDNNLDKNINDSLSLIGNYFILDRISVLALDPNTDAPYKQYSWFQSSSFEIPIGFNQEGKDLFRKALDQTGMVKIVQTGANKNSPIYDLLVSEGTTATLAFELRYENKVMGLIKYDMCSINKFWQPNDVASLNLIGKLFAIKLKKQHDEELIKKDLYYDKLTDIYNYTKWRDDVSEYIFKSKKDYSILSIDISDFKTINEEFGTKAGDKCLKIIAESFKKIDYVKAIFCRFTGDKFLIYLESTDCDIIERAYSDIEASVLKLPFGNKIFLKCGIYINIDKTTLNTSVDYANEAKKIKNSQVHLYYYTEENFLEQKRRSQIELHQEDALKNGEFLLYLQPKVNTSINKVVGAEALTRWNFNNETILSPFLFIPIFEENGFISKLDYAVFENVCKFQRECIDNNLTLIPISVNVSRYQKDFDDYINNIETIRQKYDIDPSLIEIEITEGMYIDNVDVISDFINKLHKIGYTISMDDFGSGFSNLASLAKLNFDIIKLDKNFCSNRKNEKEEIILKSIMKLSKDLDIKVLCEGVETNEYCEFLKTIGCFLIQGYLFDKPIPKDEFKDKYLK